MEELFMWAGIIAGIVLCLTGLVKLPFKFFKYKHPNWYKAVFTIISVIIAVGLCFLCEFYLLSKDIISFEFLTLLCAVFCGVFGGYGGIYEGLGLKELVKNIVEKIREASVLSNDKRVKNFLSKIENIEDAIYFLEERKNNSKSEV